MTATLFFSGVSFIIGFFFVLEIEDCIKVKHIPWLVFGVVGIVIMYTSIKIYKVLEKFYLKHYYTFFNKPIYKFKR